MAPRKAYVPNYEKDMKAIAESFANFGDDIPLEGEEIDVQVDVGGKEYTHTYKYTDGKWLLIEAKDEKGKALKLAVPPPPKKDEELVAETPVVAAPKAAPVVSEIEPVSEPATETHTSESDESSDQGSDVKNDTPKKEKKPRKPRTLKEPKEPKQPKQPNKSYSDLDDVIKALEETRISDALDMLKSMRDNAKTVKAKRAKKLGPDGEPIKRNPSEYNKFLSAAILKIKEEQPELASKIRFAKAMEMWHSHKANQPAKA